MALSSRFSNVSVVEPERRLERRDHVADHIFRRVVQQGGQPPARRKAWPQVGGDLLDDQGVLGDREGVLAHCLAIPSGDPRQAMGDVLDLDIHRRRVQQVELPA